MQNDHESSLIEIPLTSEDIGFKPDEMILCGACGRTNPPNRLNCLYCAAALDICSVDQSRLKVAPRILENWEKGFIVVIVSCPDEIDARIAGEISRNTGIETELLNAACRRTSPIPAARVEFEHEAAAIAANLARIGVTTKIVSDDILAGDQPVRCRSIVFGDDKLTVQPFNQAPEIEILRTGIQLIVSGTIYETKIESTEKRRGKTKSVISESQTSSDTPLVDIYIDGCSSGLRIQANGFDFSCLGSDKGYAAGANLTALIVKIREFAPDAKMVSEYIRDRKLLDLVWEADRRSESLGIQRSGFATKAIGNVVTSSSLLQFTKYSRMQRHFL